MSRLRRALPVTAIAVAMGCGSRSALDAGLDASADAPDVIDATDAVDATTIPDATLDHVDEPSLPPTDAGVDSWVEPSDADLSCGAQPGAPWPMVAHDRERTARSAVDGPRTAQLRWSYAFAPYNDYSSSPVVAADGTIYLASMDGKLIALQSNGSPKWIAQNVNGYGSPALGCDGTIYIQGPHYWKNGWNDDIVMAVRSNGTLAWKYTGVAPFSWPDNSPVPVPGALLFGHDGFYSFGVDASVQAHVTQGNDYGGPRVAVNDAGVAFGSFYTSDAMATAVSFELDGSIAWKHPGMGQGAILADGTFASTGDSRIAGYGPTGTELWSVDVSKPRALAIATDGRLYAFTAPGIVSIDQAHVATLVYPWTNPDGHYPSLVVDASGWVYASLYDRVVALRPDGTVGFVFDLSTLQAADDITATSLALAKDTLYVAAYRRLYVLGP